MPNDLAAIDVIAQGSGQGSVAKRMLETGFSANSLRPWTENGKTYIAVWNSEKQKFEPMTITTNDTTLRKNEWILLDRSVRAAALPRLRAVQDLRSAGLTFTLPNGMAHTVLQTQAQSDINDAIISMDGLRQGEGDRPKYDLTTLPLPIIHKDFYFSAREIAVSRNNGQPLDTTMAALAGRKVAETAEKLLLGTYGSYAFGGGNIYGYLNFPTRATVTIQDWSASATDGTDIVNDVLSMMQASKDMYHFGPWMLYVADNLSLSLEVDFKANGSKTIRQRVEEIDGISGVKSLDYLTAGAVVLVEMDPATIRLIEGMALQTVQWGTDGGMRTHFKVMTIAVPQIRDDYNDNCGLVHGST